VQPAPITRTIVLALTEQVRRTKPTLIYPETKNLRAVQLLLGHRKLDSTVRYLGVNVDDALEIAEQTEVYPSGRYYRTRKVSCDPYCNARWQ